jgi:hypothetical protein
MIELTYPSWEHSDRVKFLSKMAHIQAPDKFEVSDDGSKITIQVLIDEVVLSQYIKKFEPEEFYKDK